MRLSRLHIAGFKSFCDRAELGFDEGVTAIVGPNGCGKSNVVDAITWVLGEQSAKSLRGERMEDVIFNGSEARKPTAAAEVRLKFTQVMQAAIDAAPVGALDADPLLDARPLSARDVEIGRRLYRSGESEYLIDGEVCRLRDIHDLLMDSGLGVKAYAVIEQGKIGQILSSRPAERRMLIEEAAGVTKYKSRRRAAELKLEAAQGNLTRVDDIVFEVEKQRGALKRQAARARRYKRLREELRTWEQVHFARRYDALGQEIAAADALWHAAREREVAAAAEVASLESALETLRLGLVQTESAATATREGAHAKELEIGRRQQQIEFESRQIEELAEQTSALQSEAAELEERRGPAARAIESQRELADRAKVELDEAAHRVADREHAYGRAQASAQAVEQEADATRAAVLSASTTLSALSQARDHAAAVRDRVAAERERFEIEARDLRAELERVERAHQDASHALSQARESRDRLVSDRATAETDLAGRRRDRERMSQTLGARERELAGTEARLRSLEELEARRATFGDAARLLLAEAGDRLCPYGAVADHLVVERSYERAVDALLGDRLQHVLVDRAEHVSEALELIGARNAGRCGFIVLDDARGDQTAPARPVPEGARSLQSVVHVTGPHAGVLSRLLDEALIAESFDHARALAKTIDVPVATLAGDVFHGGWLIEGGWRQDARGILETRAEVVSLRDDVATRAAQVTELAAALAALDTLIQAAQARLVDLTTDQHTHEKEMVGAEAQAARATDERQRVGRRLDVVSTERARADAEHEGAERRRTESVSAISAHESGMRDAEVTLGAVLTRLQDARDASESAMRLVSEARAEQATWIERASGVSTELSRLEEAARELESRISNRQAEIQRTETRREQLRTSVVDGRVALDKDVLALEDLRAAMRQVDEQLAGIRQEFAGRDQAIRGARQVLDDVRGEVSQADVARARATADLTYLAAACAEAVGSTLDEVAAAVRAMQDSGALAASAAAAPGASVDDEDEVDGETAEGTAPSEEAAAAAAAASGVVDPDAIIAVLRRKIERLGPVNMMAIEQFDELEARHAFLTTQRADLLDSIQQTGEAIRKIDITTRERFSEAFEIINGHFAKTFTTLFGGGRAGLVLIDQDNDQESGIDIIAQPPGKRLQNVQLLSGGEKALTAMALMFAVFKHRPSPFCLLDEIDAPLDDANIGRFVEMLQGMQEHTQFILITHNRKTMEIADRLYGVTMEEPGVSKLISLQLN
ncbi:MAG: chromosome segregation protein SMC [Acidobacteriota bacterium]